MSKRIDTPFILKAEDHLKMVREALRDGNADGANFSLNHAIDCLRLLSNQIQPKFGVWINNLNRWCYLTDTSEFDSNFYGTKKWASRFVSSMNEKWGGHSYVVGRWNDGKPPNTIVNDDGSFTSLN